MGVVCVGAWLWKAICNFMSPEIGWRMNGVTAAGLGARGYLVTENKEGNVPRSGRSRNSQVSKRIQCDRVVGSVVHHLRCVGTSEFA